MMVEVICGHLMKKRDGSGRVVPCVLKRGHKQGHRDADFMEAQRVKSRAKHWANREQKNAYSRQWHAAHREEANARSREWYKANRGDLSAEGYAYVLSSSWSPAGLVKIGSAVDLAYNLKSARRYLPDAEHLRVYPGGKWLELRYLHVVFADRRAVNEWFAVTPEEVDAAVKELNSCSTAPSSVTLESNPMPMEG